MGKKNSDDGLTWLNNSKILHFSLDFLLSLILSYVTMQNCKIHNPPLLAQNPQNQILSWHFLHIKILSKWPSENTREVSKAPQFQAMKLKIKIAWRINASQTYKGFFQSKLAKIHQISFIFSNKFLKTWSFFLYFTSQISSNLIMDTMMCVYSTTSRDML